MSRALGIVGLGGSVAAPSRSLAMLEVALASSGDAGDRDGRPRSRRPGASQLGTLGAEVVRVAGLFSFEGYDDHEAECERARENVAAA